MGVLSWGKPKIEKATSSAGVAGSAWAVLDTPKEDTTKLTPTAGTEQEATEEGGELIDARPGKTKYTFEFDLFVKKGTERPFEDQNGIIAGEHALRLVPEDETCEGIIIERCTISMQENYTSKDGKLLHYVAKCLKPKTGKTVKIYTANGLVVTPSQLYFTGTADTTGKTITATSTDNITATSSESWCTVTTSGKVATVKAAANSIGTDRTAIVTISADGKTTQVAAMQIPT